MLQAFLSANCICCCAADTHAYTHTCRYFIYILFLIRNFSPNWLKPFTWCINIEYFNVLIKYSIKFKVISNALLLSTIVGNFNWLVYFHPAYYITHESVRSMYSTELLCDYLSIIGDNVIYTVKFLFV